MGLKSTSSNGAKNVGGYIHKELSKIRDRLQQIKSENSLKEARKEEHEMINKYNELLKKCETLLIAIFKNFLDQRRQKY